ncbi:condensation domain-containing protein, partial [Williamsia sp.]|uniref:condensation domain-containing protein n=1 Tax=Williamsia sp. TaxID=1872085 RepID=UPI001A312BDE
ELDPVDLRERLRVTLPRRSIPGIITIVDELPRTRGGKLDRSALAVSPVATAATGAAPSTAHELAVAKVWSEVIGIPAERIDTASDFFALGGTSLSATRATARLREHTGRPISVRQLFDARSVRSVAALLDSLDEVAPTTPPEHLPVPDDLPLSYPQRRLWILNRIDVASTAYTVPVVLRIRGALDVEGLRTAVAEIPARHDSLRTVYPDTPDGPRQVVLAVEDLGTVALRRVPVESAEAVIAEIVSAPFDLVAEPGFRAEILEVAGSDEWLLVIAMHHVAVDGWSMRTVLDELVAAYLDGPGRDRATDLTYTDFTQWQLRRLGDPEDPTSQWARHLGFWTDTLAGVGDPIRLPHTNASGSGTGRGGRIHTELDDDLVAALHRVAAGESATLFHLAHAALATVIGQWTGRHDLVIGAPVLGRTDPAWEPVVGMFVNTLPLRTVLDPDATISDTLRRVRDTDLAATAHDEIPYDAVARAVRPGHHGRSDPLISVLLVQQEIGAVLGGRLDLPIDGVQVELAGSPELLVGAKFDVEVVFGRLPGDPLGITVIHSGAVPGSVAGRLLDDYVATLAAVADDPRRPFPRLDGVAASTTPATVPAESPEAEFTADSALAHTVRAAMADVLHLDPAALELDDDFFALGGTSLSATQVVSIIGRELGRPVSVGALFDASSPRGLARAVATDVTSGRPQPPPLDAVAVPRRSDPVPLTSAQRRMWFVDQLSDGRSGAVVPLAVPVPPGLADHRVRAALRAVADRHVPLRSIYPDSPNGPVAVALPTFTPPLTVVGAVGDANAAIATAVGAGFDITLLPPIRGVLIGAGDHRMLVVVVHHVAMDGQSVPILSADLSTAMSGEWLAPLDIGYPSVAVWESTIPADVRSDELAAWRTALAGYPGVVDLPTDRPRGVHRSTETTTLTVDLGSQSSDVRRTARTVGLTEFHVLHAALAVTLGSWAGVDDVAIGAPASLRRHPETADMVGMFTSTVVLRTEMPAGIGLLDFLYRVRDTDVAALDHTLVGFDEIVAVANPPRDAGRHPLVQVMLSLVPETDVGSAGLELGDAHAPSPHSEFDLQLTVSGSSGRLTAAFVYATELFDRTTIENLADQWRRALTQIASLVADPGSTDVPLDLIDLRSDDEVRAQTELASVWSTSLPMTLGDVFAGAVRTHPDAVALDDGVQTLTYTDLDGWSAAVADDLRAHGVGPGDPVAVALSRSVESVVALWAVARVGAVYAPIDPRQPEDRVRRILDITAPRAGVVGPVENRALTTRIDMALLRVPPRPTHPTGVAGWAPVPFDSVAYVVFTSGSTGVPNAVSVTHRGLALYGGADVFGLGTTDRVAHMATPTFDAALLEILLATAAGATLVVIAPDRVGGSIGTAELMVRDVSAMFITPAVLATLDPKPLVAVRTIWVGGDVVPADLVRTWNSGRRIEVVYGPTEATMVATHRPIPASTTTPDAVIGDAFDTLGTAVLDTHLRPVPDGVTGELYLFGPALAQGYHRADLTAARFVATADGSRMYRTGDLVRRTAGGLQFRGRTDAQRQIRGLRVEPGEVDAVLIDCGATRSATIVVHGPVGDVLVSYVVGDTAGTDLRAAAAVRLPAHMVPAQIIAMTALPLTPNGKLDVPA